MDSANEPPKTFMQKILDVVERVGNKVPHPVVIFLILIGLVMVLSAVLGQLGVSATLERIDPATNELLTSTVTVRSLLNLDGIRFLYESLISNFMAFTAVGLLIAVMLGAGVMEESGLIKTSIRKLVHVSPAWSLSYIVAFVGILSSLAADAGYLVLLPLAGAAFVSVGRHPLAGLALAYAAVAGAFTVNMFIKPLDAVLVQLTNDAIHILDPTRSIGLASNLWFSIASVIFLTVLVGFLTDHVVEPRLGKYTPSDDATDGADAQADEAHSNELTPAESRGLRFAGLGVVALLAVFALLLFPRWAPLRAPQEDGWGPIIGDSPFMNGLIVLIILLFLVSGWCYGLGAGTVRTVSDVIKAMEKSVTGIGATIFLFFVIAQFVAYFVYTNIGTVMALNLSGALSGIADKIGLLPLLLLFIIVVTIIDIFIVAAIAKWAIFAPVFVPLMMKLGATPDAVLAAYRIGDSAMNALTPVNAYFGLVVGFARKYDKSAGVGTVVAMMLPYFAWMQLLWMALFAVWYLLGLPWGF